MIQCIYTSEACSAFTDKEITDVLSVSNENNTKYHVSGFLFYVDNHFLQILEGPESGVNTIYDKIAANPNHQILIESQYPMTKQTPLNKWAMGYDASLNSLMGIKQYCQEYDIHHYETAFYFLKRRLAQQTANHSTSLYNLPH